MTNSTLHSLHTRLVNLALEEKSELAPLKSEIQQIKSRYAEDRRDIKKETKALELTEADKAGLKIAVRNAVERHERPAAYAISLELGASGDAPLFAER